MPAKNKTVPTEVKVEDFINAAVEKDERRQECFRLVGLMREWSGCEPYMWGPSIIGFGSYHYKYASGREGDAPLIGFSPRKAAFSLYVTSPGHKSEEQLGKLGKYTMSKACIYVKKLDDIDLDVLEQLSRETLRYTLEHNECGVCK